MKKYKIPNYLFWLIFLSILGLLILFLVLYFYKIETFIYKKAYIDNKLNLKLNIDSKLFYEINQKDYVVLEKEKIEYKFLIRDIKNLGNDVFEINFSKISKSLKLKPNSFYWVKLIFHNKTTNFWTLFV